MPLKHSPAENIGLAEYLRSGQTVTVSRELAVQFAGSVCGEPDLVRWKAFFTKLQRDLRSQVVYR